MGTREGVGNPGGMWEEKPGGGNRRGPRRVFSAGYFERRICQLVDQVKSATAAVYLTDADQGLEDVGYPDRRRDEESAPQGVSLRELKTSKVRGNLFDVMVNSRKLLAFESRDPYLTVWNPAAQEKTPWDRFCKTQYDLFVNNGGNYE